MTQEEKNQAIEILRHRYPEQRATLLDVDYRLDEYFAGLLSDAALHNGYEILCAVKFLRLLRTYSFDIRKVQRVIWLREGNWHQTESGQWVYDSDGLKCPGTDQPHVYRWQPFQIFVLASVFGFQSFVNTHVQAKDRLQLLPTERVADSGEIEDLRRLCSYFVCYFPRKCDKTGMSAYIQLIFFLMEDDNAEIYCAAMSEAQSKILFNRVKFMLAQLNGSEQWRMTEKIVDWKKNFRKVRNSSITPLTAGGKAKDGMFAALVNWDEFGSSPYVNGKNDMQNLINVMRSSMGPRRNPLTFGTTTAGTILQGPFSEMLSALHTQLLREISYESGEDVPTYSDDRTLCLLLEPDDWEKSDIELLMHSRDIWRKVNPMLGITVQYQFYEDSAAEVATGKMTRSEFLSKLINIYQSATISEWMNPDEIRRCQVPLRIDDLHPVKGTPWQIFVGMDFSLCDDLYAHSYLCVNTALPAPQQFFVDMDAWITRETMQRSQFRVLFEQWESDGWLHVVDESAIPPGVSLQRFDELVQSGCGVFRAVGYDPFASKIPINALTAYIQSLGVSDPNQMVIPCRQTNAYMNSPIDEITYMIRAERPWLQFSNNPMWVWEAGNVLVELDRMESKRFTKRAHDAKIDNFAALCDAVQLYDIFDGKLN